jgi:site-specific DNA recombinase
MALEVSQPSSARQSSNGQPARRVLRLDGYIRVSAIAGRDPDSDRYITETIQEEKIRHWIKGKDDAVLGELFLDRNVSGGTMDRPGLKDVMRRIKSGESDGVVVYNISRFSRSLKNTVKLIESIRERGALFAAVQDQVDLSTWQGRQTFNILQSIAEGERERIGETWGQARAMALERGVSVVRTPYGYKKDADGKLVVDSGRARRRVASCQGRPGDVRTARRWRVVGPHPQLAPGTEHPDTLRAPPRALDH